MKKIILLSTFVALSFIAGYLFSYLLPLKADPKSIEVSILKKERPLERYSIENLQNANIPPGKLTIGTPSEGEGGLYTSSIFSFSFHPNLDEEVVKNTTGLINIPKSETTDAKFPVVVMIRGFVDQTIYKTGVGTQRAGEYFASHGLITVAPDFLGYADSDSEADNIFESRFQTYTTVLSLLKSINQIPNWDGKNIFIWGHSNGGQIATIILEVTKKDYPTVLWAPVSKPFPYSILYYTDESEDKGKFIRAKLAEFETDYDVEQYSLDNYFGDAAASIQIHQGTGDDAVPYTWSKNLFNTLKDSYKERGLDLDLVFYLYPGADHNLQPDWKTVVERSLNFYQNHLTN